MAAQPHQLPTEPSDASDVPDPLVAVATDDGAVRLHTVEPGRAGMQFQKAVAHADARALHVLWRADGAVLYAAFSNGCISILNASTGAHWPEHLSFVPRMTARLFTFRGCLQRACNASDPDR